MDADQLPRTLSHDLRGPLMAISGAAELISAIAAPGDPEIRDWCHQIHHATSVMERLIHDLLEVGSFEDAQLRLRPASHDLSALARGAVDAFQQATSAKTSRRRLPRRRGGSRCDRNRIVQVVLICATPSPSRRMADRSARVRRRENETVSIANTGAGAKRPGTRSSNDSAGTTASARAPASRLHREVIVGAHHGRIWVKPRRRGSICFTLPVARCAD
jgi:signal transduction histidine kinase